MEKEKAFLLWFDQLERKDVAIAGGKSSSLGELTLMLTYLYRMASQLLPALTDTSLKRPVCTKRSKL